MEEVNVKIPGGGELKALRLQDLPANHVMTFLALPDGLRQQMCLKLFTLALGPEAEGALVGMTFGELEFAVQSWLAASSASEESDPDGRGLGLDWSELLQ